MANLLKQVVQKQQHLSRPLREAFDFRKSLSLEEYLGLLKAEMRRLTEIFVVIDALDECPSEKGGGTREILLEALSHLPKNVKFFFTSRKLPSIKDSLKSDVQIRIEAREEDLHNYIENRVNESSDLKRAVDLRCRQDASFRETFFNTLVNQAQNTSACQYTFPHQDAC
jgi:hypothetical protein